jgi:hypothetical protein
MPSSIRPCVLWCSLVPPIVSCVATCVLWWWVVPPIVSCVATCVLWWWVDRPIVSCVATCVLWWWLDPPIMSCVATCVLWWWLDPHIVCSYTRHNRRNYPSPKDTWAHIQGRTPNIEFTDGNTAVSSAILESTEDDQYLSKPVVCVQQWCKRDFNV